MNNLMEVTMYGMVPSVTYLEIGEEFTIIKKNLNKDSLMLWCSKKKKNMETNNHIVQVVSPEEVQILSAEFKPKSRWIGYFLMSLPCTIFFATLMGYIAALFSGSAAFILLYLIGLPTFSGVMMYIFDKRNIIGKEGHCDCGVYNIKRAKLTHSNLYCFTLDAVNVRYINNNTNNLSEKPN
jgi:hypothetical protein